MADKRYFWLKLKENFFEDEAINWLEEQENGKEYVLFYLRLCLKSLKNDGILIRKVGTMLVPYDENKLAEVTKTDLDIVVNALRVLQDIGLVEHLEDGKLFLTQLQTMVGSEVSSAGRMRRLRASHCDTDVQKCDEKVTTEYRDKSIEYRDRDKSIDKELEIDYKKIVDMYNDTCVSFPPLSKLSDSRRKSIDAIFSTGYTYDDFKKLFEKTENSKFLKGSNDRNWVANFDWLIKDDNMVKVLDGNYDEYDNKSSTSDTNDSVSKDIDHDQMDMYDPNYDFGYIPEGRDF